MNQRAIRQLYGALVTAIALTVILGATSAAGQSDSGTPSPQDPCLTVQAEDERGPEATPPPSMADMEMAVEFDLMFIDMMIPHHQRAVSMSEVALGRSTNEEIRNLAADIISSQAAEIDQMTEWRESWYPGAPAALEDHAMQSMDISESDMMSMDSGAMLAELCDAEDVDVSFIELMIPHHQSAIVMAEMAVEEAGHDEIRELAEVIVETQSAEITLMQDLLAGLTGTPPAQV